MLVEEREQIDDQIRALNRDSIKLWDDCLDENYTINIELNLSDWERAYKKLVHGFEKSETSLYVYPFERLHMTILGRIDKAIDPRKIVEVVSNRTHGKRLVFRIGYLACNELGVSIVAEPEFNLGKLRSEIREDLGIKGDDYTKYLSIYERLAWLNFVRFKKIPGEKFFETLWNMRNYQFGKFEAKGIDIYLNTSRTMNPAKCKLVGVVPLSKEQ